MECGKTNDSVSLEEEGMQMPDQPYLEVRTFVWEKDSQGLFDYESKKTSRLLFRIQGCCRLYYNTADSEVSFESIDLPHNESPGLKHMFDIFVEQHEESKIFSMEAAPPEEGKAIIHPYLVIRSLKTAEGTPRGYELKPGDIVRMGKQELLVREFRAGGAIQVASGEHLPQLQKSEPFRIEYRKEAEGPCRVCYEEQTQSNPYISPCQCRGSCSFVHVSCLKRWIASKITQQFNRFATVYSLANFKCEICQSPYPQKVVRRRKETVMLELDRPKRPYVRLESLSGGERERAIYVVRMPEESEHGRIIRVGRAYSCEVRMLDFSVSRSQAFIRYEQQKFLLFDNNSKFGTLVRLRDSVVFGYDLIAVQVGRTVITFCMRHRRAADPLVQ